MKNTIKKGVIKLLLAVLKDPDVRRAVWDVVNRPDPETVRRPGPINPSLTLWEQASRDAAGYVEQHLLKVPFCETRAELFERALQKVETDGLYLEFGSAYGRSTNFLAERISGTLHGFDSFEGLPEDWFGDLAKGTFHRQGELPKVRDNVVLHKGWFDDTLPEFVKTHTDKVAFIHIDCDLYSSTKIVFDWLADRFVKGSVIVFGEYFNYPGWKEHEYKAFHEFVDRSGLTYEHLGYSSKYHVAVRMT